MLLVVAPLVATVALTAAGCSNQSSAGSTAGAAAPQRERGNSFNADKSPAGRVDAASGTGAPAGRDVQQRAVISTGQVQLTSDDVAATRDRVDALLAREQGRIADEDTLTDEQGTVTNAGGSNWRWDARYRFNYSRRDATWQLVHVQESNYHVDEVRSAKPKVSRPPTLGCFRNSSA